MPPRSPCSVPREGGGRDRAARSTRAPAEPEAQLVRGGCSVALGPRTPGWLCKGGGECAGPGLCMKPLDPSEQRQRRRRSRAERSPRRAAPGSASRCLRGCGLPHGPLLRLPAAEGRGPGGAVETRRRRRRRKRRRPGPGGGQHLAAAPGSPCSWPRPWWCGNG